MMRMLRMMADSDDYDNDDDNDDDDDDDACDDDDEGDAMNYRNTDDQHHTTSYFIMRVRFACHRRNTHRVQYAGVLREFSLFHFFVRVHCSMSESIAQYTSLYVKC